MTNYDGGTTLSVKTAIDVLRPMVTAPRGIFTQNEKIALSMAISALEKEKEPALQEAKTSSNNNNSISNDNTKLKECQVVIKFVASNLIEYYRDQLSEGEQKAWELGEVYRKVLDAQNLFEEEKQCQ